MSIPVDHHFLPIFYTAGWASPLDGKVVEFRRPYKNLVWKRKFPSATGYRAHLYAVSTREDEAERQELELKTMSSLDSDASRALVELRQENTIHTPELRIAWARFLTSLMYRSPHRIEGLRRKVRTLDSPSLEAKYARLRGPHDPPTVAAFLEGADEAFHHESAALLLKKLVSADRTTVPAATAMKWRRVTLRNQAHSLLTCDDPLLMSNGISRPESFIAVPIAPDALFLATNDEATAQGFLREWSSRKATVPLNAALCEQAKIQVIADNQGHFVFVDKRMLVDRSDEGGLDRDTWLAPTG